VVCESPVFTLPCYVFRWDGETLRESIKRYEHFLALQLGLTEGMKVSKIKTQFKLTILPMLKRELQAVSPVNLSQVLDVGCGIGGPLREIAKFRYVWYVDDPHFV
jgi:sterol 24-C-methyltransferase